MGGGAAMRAAGKVTGMAVFNGGLRGGSFTPPVEQALRSVSRPAAVGATVSSGVSSGVDVSAVQKASWEADWEFAGVEDLSPPPEPIARVVFDAAPTLQEAKEATTDLKEALDKVYLASPGYENGGVNGGSAFGLPLTTNLDNLEIKGCVSCDPKSVSVPASAFNAFKMLSDSPAVQSVVASIAADQKVWDAVMENEELKEFMRSQKSTIEVQQPVSNFDESVDSSPSVDSASQSGNVESAVDEFFQKVKNSVVEMMSNVSDFFQNLFSPPPEKAEDASAGFGTAEKTIGASLMGLAIMVITVVVLKRA